MKFLVKRFIVSICCYYMGKSTTLYLNKQLLALKKEGVDVLIDNFVQLIYRDMAIGCYLLI